MQRFGTIIGAIAIVIVGILIGHFAIPPPDGNPIGYHLHGLAKMDQPAPSLSSCSNVNPCTLQFDAAFDPSAAPKSTPTPCPSPASSGCVSFSNLPDANLQALTVTIDYTGYSGTYTDYAVGVIKVSLPPSSRLTPSARPTPRP